ncbi:hypothetical protein R6Q57_007269 [Mikania cordata]
MPKSSRSKSHKQIKHSSKEYSGSDEDVKMKERSSNGGKEDVVSVRVLKDSSVSGERRKHGKDLSSVHGNGGSDDRWNGGSSDDKGLVVNVEDELLKSKDLLKTVGESKSKSSRRHGDDSAGLTGLEKDENKSGSGNRGEKRKLEKESARKESSQYKEHKESKDKDHGSDRGRKANPDKLETEAPSKQLENQSTKRGKEITEWPIEQELRNPELEKELEKRMRRRGEASGDKDRYLDVKENEDRQLSTRKERSKDERHKNEEYGDARESRKKAEKHREDGDRDRKNRDVKYRGESGRYNKHRDDKYHEDKYSDDGNKETKYKDDKYMELGDKDDRSRDRKHRQDDDRDYKHKEEKRTRDSKYRDLPEAKRLRDDNAGSDFYPRKTNNRDGSPVYDDRAGRYKDDKDRRRGNEKDESSDYRSRSSMKEQRSESEKKSSAKADPVSEWGRPSSRYAEGEIVASHSRRRSSPGGSSYPTRDHHRFSKQEETEYRDYPYEDQARPNVNSSRDFDSVPGQSDKKVTSKDDGYTGGDLSGEKRPKPESRSFPQVDKSPSSTSNERRNLIKSDARKSLDLEEPGPQSGSKDTVKDGKGSRELVNETHPNNDFPQADNDNLSVSSPYTRNSQFSGNSSIRHRRMVDPNMNRGQSQNQGHGNWNNVPNWPSPMATGGYIPFQPVQPPMFHPLMQQYPPQMFGRPPMKLNHGLPYHVSDHGPPLTWRNQADESVPPPLHGWDANNAVFGDESHLYGRLDWDPRTQLNNRGWDQSGEMWKNQNAGGSMEVQSGQQKDGYSGHRSNDENWSGLTGRPDEGEQNQPDIQPEILNLGKNGSETQKVTESVQLSEVIKEENNALISQAYLSRVDVSKDLAHPELFDKCTGMMNLDQETLFDCKILFLEEGVDVDVTDNSSLFSAIDDSVFQKAMFLYKKQKEEFQLKNKSADDVAADCSVTEDSKENDGPPNKLKEPMNIEVDPAVVKQEEEHESTVAVVKVSLASSAGGSVEDASEPTYEDKNGGGLMVLPDTGGSVEDASEPTYEDKNGGGLMVLSDVSAADVAVMPTESIESGSVNLNRIHHHSPESTH